MISKRPSPGQPNPKPTLLQRVQNAAPDGYTIRNDKPGYFNVYKTPRNKLIISWPIAVAQSWVATRDQVEKVVVSAIKHYERRNP